MSPSPEAAAAAPLPADVATLQALLLAERATAAKLAGHNEQLRAIIKELQRALFGRRSEKTADPDQLQLALEDLEQALAQSEAAAETSDATLKASRSQQRRVNRGALPRHLPREEIVIEPAEQTCPCCDGAMHRIGEDVAERLDVIPAQFRVIVTRRPKYGCRACESAVVQAPAPARLIEGGLPTEALVAHVLVGKYADHLPLYRQSQIYARQGIELDRSTLADWVGHAAAELRPLHERLFEHLKRSPKLFMRASTRLARRCLIRGGDEPRPATSGRSPATTGRGAAAIHRRSPISTRLVVAPSTPSGRWPGSAASSRWTRTPPTTPWPIPRAPAVR